MVSLTEILVVIATSLVCAGGVLFLLGQTRRQKSGMPDAPNEPMSFLFDDGVLHHATHNALTSFALLPGAHVWDDLRQSLLNRFPQFPETATNKSVGSMTMLPQREDDSSVLTLHWRESLCWVEISEKCTEISAPYSTRKNFQILKYASDTSPHPVWETTADGTVGWRNPAYDALVSKCGHRSEASLFEAGLEPTTNRLPLKTGPQATEWFEVTSLKKGDNMLHHATSVTHLLEAKDVQRTFVQTLAKTFAQLPIGLAIFDRKGQLSIFNPALVDLSGLGAQFLAGQPTMMSFFDAMRENRRMPEPKNYNTWRKDMAAMITAAANDHYRETWTLEDGRTYTVQGRSHPDGATAFVIEDISAEVSQTRNFRTEVEQYEALLNKIEDALIVFSSGGVVTFSNETYHQMWGQNPEAAFADVTIQDAISLWQTKAESDWTKISNFIQSHGAKKELSVTFVMGSGQEMPAQLTPIGMDATLIRFLSKSVEQVMATPKRP